jgi:threonine synthase
MIEADAVAAPMSPYSTLHHLECSRCGQTRRADQLQGLCPCGAPLLARYDLERARGLVDRRDLSGRGPTLWRYHELLPASTAADVVSLGEGMTPLVPCERLGRKLGIPDLWIKDESLVPSGTFKARGAAVGVSRARELGASGIAMPTNGNAGAAWALYCARAGLEALIAMPVDAPTITRAECEAAGAELYLVEGHIGDAGKLIGAAVGEREGYQDVSTLKEPYRLEGKKTMGYEILEQLGWQPPDVIVYPAGGGVGIIGIYKALREMQELGWVTDEVLPRLVVVQATGCAPVVQAFELGARECTAVAEPHTVAYGINVPKPLGDFLMLDALYDTGGTAIAVEDADLLAGQLEVAGAEGMWVCPEGGACVTAAQQLRESRWISQADRVVLLNTGSGIKYPDAVRGGAATVLSPGEPIPSAPAGRRGARASRGSAARRLLPARDAPPS